MPSALYFTRGSRPLTELLNFQRSPPPLNQVLISERYNLFMDRLRRIGLLLNRVRRPSPVGWAYLALLAMTGLACRTMTAWVIPETTTTPPAMTATELHTTPVSPPTITFELPPCKPPPLALESGYAVQLHPDGDLYVGDQISIEVIAPLAEDMEGPQARVRAPSRHRCSPQSRARRARPRSLPI